MSSNVSLQEEAIRLARAAASAPFESDPVMRQMVEEILARSPMERIEMLQQTLDGYDEVR